MKENRKGGQALKVKFLYMAIVGSIGGVISFMFGEWTTALLTLIMLMGFDLLTGGFIIPIIFKRSPKTESGGIQSCALGKGICRKLYRVLLVAVAYRLDLTFGVSYIKDTLVVAFIFEETLSLLENGALMGVPIPTVFTDALDVLKNKKLITRKENVDVKRD